MITKTMAMLVDAIVSTDGNIIVLCKYNTNFKEFIYLTDQDEGVGVFPRDVNHARQVIRTDWGSTLRFITTGDDMDVRLRGYDTEYVFTNDPSVIGNETISAICASKGAPIVLGCLFDRHGNG